MWCTVLRRHERIKNRTYLVYFYMISSSYIAPRLWYSSLAACNGACFRRSHRVALPFRSLQKSHIVMKIRLSSVVAVGCRVLTWLMSFALALHRSPLGLGTVYYTIYEIYEIYVYFSYIRNIRYTTAQRSYISYIKVGENYPPNVSRRQEPEPSPIMAWLL